MYIIKSTRIIVNHLRAKMYNMANYFEIISSTMIRYSILPPTESKYMYATT